MNFYNHTQAWLKGELTEALLIFCFGIATIAAGFLFWKIGSTPAPKALLVPFLLAGIIYVGIGAGMFTSNRNRWKQYPTLFMQDQHTFICSEQKRVEDFQYGYTVSKIVASICFPLTLLIFFYTKGTTWQGIGIGLSYFALAGLMVDYFSQERADLYYRAILKALQ